MNLTDNSKDIEALKNTVGYTATKNLFKNTGEGYTSNGVTFTVNEDGGVTVNGTPTIDKSITIGTNITLPNGEYILSGCPEGGSESTYYLRIQIGSNLIKDVGNGVKFVIDNTKIMNVIVYVVKNTVFDNLKFYPMIRRADVTDDTYEPYVGDVDSRLNSLQSALEWKLYISLSSSGKTSVNALMEKNYKEVLLAVKTSSGVALGSAVLNKELFEANINSGTSAQKKIVCHIPSGGATNVAPSGYVEGNYKRIENGTSYTLDVYYR